VIELKKGLLLALLVPFLLGCVSEDVVKRVEEKHSKASDYSGSVVVTDNLTGFSYKADFWIKKPGKQKIVYTYPEEAKSRTVISNGSIVWFYDTKDDLAIYAEVEDVQMPDFDYWPIFERIVNESKINLIETELYKRATYLIEAKPEITGMMDIQINIWIDKEELYPLQMQWIADSTEILKVEYQNMTFNTGLSDEFFEFSLPNVTIMSIEEWRGKRLSFSSIEDAQKIVDFEIVIPTKLPAEDFNYKVEVVKQGFEVTVVILYYNNSTIFEIREKISDEPLEPRDVQVNIGNRTAYFSSTDLIRTLTWKKDNIEITITGTLDKESILEIAKSMN
jgi:outer membrane lipoprotein-sorting protein